MNQMPSNEPIVESKPGSAGWLPVWTRAVTQPKEQTYIEITEHPDAKSKTAYLWIFIAGTLSMLVTGIIQALLLAAGVTPQAVPGMEGLYGGGSGAPALGSSLLTTICGAPVAGLLSVIFFAINIAIVQWVAKMFGGTGTFEKLSYGVAAYSVPITLVSMLLAPFSIVPYMGICTGLLSFGVGIYALFLEILAVKAVNRFGWGAAAGSVLIPVAVIIFFCSCLVIGGLMLMGPIIGDVFSEINQSLQMTP